MRKLLKRWYFWLGLVLLLGLTGSVALIYCNPSRITQANFDRIQDGMAVEEIARILGRPPDRVPSPSSPGLWFSWFSGPNWISVLASADGSMSFGKVIHIAGARETLKWYAKEAAEKIGVKWD